MAVSLEEVRDIAELAKLELTEEEISTYAQQLSDILEYFEHLQGVDTSGVPAIASVLPLSNVWRDDAPAEPLGAERATANAPQSRDDQFRVRAVLDE